MFDIICESGKMRVYLNLQIISAFLAVHLLKKKRNIFRKIWINLISLFSFVQYYLSYIDTLFLSFNISIYKYQSEIINSVFEYSDVVKSEQNLCGEGIFFGFKIDNTFQDTLSYVIMQIEVIDQIAKNIIVARHRTHNARSWVAIKLKKKQSNCNCCQGELASLYSQYHFPKCHKVKLFIWIVSKKWKKKKKPNWKWL